MSARNLILSVETLKPNDTSCAKIAGLKLGP